MNTLPSSHELVLYFKIEVMKKLLIKYYLSQQCRLLKMSKYIAKIHKPHKLTHLAKEMVSKKHERIEKPISRD
jgi:hypothetical protein